MELDVHFRLRWNLSSKLGVCGMADESYIRGLTETIRARIESTREQTRKENREAEIVKLEAPKQWMGLKTWLKEAVRQVNQGLDKNTILYIEESINEIVIRSLLSGEPRDVRVEFLGFTGQVIAKGILFPGASHDFEYAFDPKVAGNQMHYIQDKLPNARKSIEEIGKEILDRTVKP